jgi:hypothetical protein
MIRLGWTHASVIGMLQPEVAHPGRKVKASPSIITMVFREPCTCPDTHIELWCEPTEVDEQERLFY